MTTVSVPLLAYSKTCCPRPNAPHWPICGWWGVAAQFGEWQEFRVGEEIRRRREIISWGYVLGAGPYRYEQEMARLSEADRRPTDYRGKVIE